jgi:hypothetical protein
MTSEENDEKLYVIVPSKVQIARGLGSIAFAWIADYEEAEVAIVLQRLAD